MSIEVISIASGIIVGLVFVSAGILKLTNSEAWRRQANDMGVRRPIAAVVPWIEIVLGALTAVHVLGPFPAVALLLLIIVFTGVIIIRLLDGSRPPCACFGARSTRPLGMYHVLRNLGFIALAVVTIAGA